MMRKIIFVVLVLLVFGCSSSTQGSRQTVGYVTFWFDDGLATTFYVAHPLLEKKGWPAVLSVIASQKDAMAAVSPDGDSVMSLNQVKELANAGWEISDHSMTHRRVSSLDAESQYYEMIVSRSILEQELNVPIYSFTGPFGEIGNAGYVYEFYYWRTMRQTINPVPPQSEIGAFFLTSDTTRGDIQKWISETEQTGGWLVVGMHALVSQPKQWQSTPEQFITLLEEVEKSNLKVILPHDLFGGQK